MFVLGTERHDSRRVDNQLRGRAGRQGDPGESIFYISLEDDLARLFGGERLKSVANFFNLPEDQPITNMKMMGRQIEQAQKRVEGMNFARRRDILYYDDVLAKQREVIYTERNKVLEGVDIHEEVLEMIKEQVKQAVRGAISDRKLYSEWKLDKLNNSLEDARFFARDTDFITEDNVEGFVVKDVIKLVLDAVLERYDRRKAKVEELGYEFADFERTILLKQVDAAWIEHIDQMTMLRSEISTRTDPLTAYKQEGYEMFEGVIDRVRENTGMLLLNAQLKARVFVRKPLKNLKMGPVERKKIVTFIRKEAKVGRNDPCPCGSGKKYKSCCINK